MGEGAQRHKLPSRDDKSVLGMWHTARWLQLIMLRCIFTSCSQRPRHPEQASPGAGVSGGAPGRRHPAGLPGEAGSSTAQRARGLVQASCRPSPQAPPLWPGEVPLELPSAALGTGRSQAAQRPLRRGCELSVLALPGGAASPASSSPPGGKGHGYKLGLDTGCLRMTKQPEKLGAGARPLEQSQLRPVFKARGARGDGAEGPASQAR